MEIIIFMNIKIVIIIIIILIITLKEPFFYIFLSQHSTAPFHVMGNFCPFRGLRSASAHLEKSVISCRRKFATS